jgi:hypothetical protein
MNEKYTLGEWSDSISAFWFGANDCEWIAWKGAHQIFVYPCGEHPKPPSQVIQHTERIETLEDFTEAMETGVLYEATYKEGKAHWQELAQTSTIK